jgi:acyl CoA:acetate/3-ketoacid CoA transferase
VGRRRGRRADGECDYGTGEDRRSAGEKGEGERARLGEEMDMMMMMMMMMIMMMMTMTTTMIKKNRCEAYLSCDGMITETLPCSIGRNAPCVLLKCTRVRPGRIMKG